MSYLTPGKLEVGYSLTRKRRERGYKREELTRFGRIPSHKATLLWLVARYAFVEKSSRFAERGKILFGHRAAPPPHGERGMRSDFARAISAAGVGGQHLEQLSVVGAAAGAAAKKTLRAPDAPLSGRRSEKKLVLGSDSNSCHLHQVSEEELGETYPLVPRHSGANM